MTITALALTLVAACGNDEGTTTVVNAPVRPIATAISVEGWQGENDIWNDQILALFNSSSASIRATYSSMPPVEFNETIDDRIAAGTAGDVVACHPFDWTLDRANSGLFSDLTDLPGLDRFNEQALAAFSTDDGFKRFCVPVISNTTGFMYNKEIFAELGLSVPTTTDEFFAVLDAIRNDGGYVPLAVGVSDAAWVASALGYEAIGPTYWDGEVGRLRLISGAAHMTDREFVEPFEILAKWEKYLPPQPEQRTRQTALSLFVDGKAAITPAGSWEIGTAPKTEFERGMFAPPSRDDTAPCVVIQQPDLGFALNSNSRNKNAAKTLLEWLTTTEFANEFTKNYPGLFSLQRDAVKIDDPVVAGVSAWFQSCDTTRRLSGQVLSRDGANFETELATVSSRVLLGTMTPQDAAAYLETVINRG